MTDHADFPALDLRAEIARIDRDRAETAKLKVETQWHPWIAMGSAFTAGAAVIGAIIAALHFIGVR